MTRKRRSVLSEPATEPHGVLSFELLEPRVMFSADPLGVADLFIASDGDDAHEDETALIAPWEAEPAGYPSPLLTGAVDEPFQALAKETHSPLELVFIDASLADSALLAQQIEALNPHAQIQTYFIDTQVDGVAEITSVLSGYQGVQAVHLFSHAGDGALQLGNTLLDEAGLTGYAEQIANWQRALVADGDLLLYGCNLAASDIGVSFVDSLVTLSGLDVAASTDLTGNTTTGGNWQLEHQNGDITYTLNVAQNAWQGTLAIYNVTIFDDIIDSGDGELSLREAVIAANGDAVKDTIVLAAGTYNLTILLALGEEYQQDLDIKESLIIIGAGADQTFINAGNNFGVFQFKSQALDNEIQGITIQNGDVAGSGGAIAMEKSGGTLLLKDVEITGSSASSNGGAIYNVGNLVMERVTLAGNSASSGGGLYNDTGATASLTNVTISGNSVTGDGGGAFNLGTLNLTNVTVAKNHAGNMGGGLFQSSSGATSLTNTVVSNNTAGTSAVDVSGAFSSDGSNFIADQTGSTGFGSDQSGDPRLDVLANYGGQTRTHAMLTASPLVDAGTNTGAPTEDQRGQTRVGIADIGAYEFIPNQAPTLTATSLNPTYTEGAGAAVVFSGADANTVEAGQTFSAVTLTITNITDGSAEVLNISSIAIALTHLNSGTIAGFNYSVTLAGSTATLSLTGGSANSTAMNALINSISYQNNSQDPTAATRRLTITSLQDNGGTEGSGADTASPDLVSDITVQPVNDAPTLILNSTTPTFTEGGAAVAVYNSANASTVESGQRFSGLSLQISNLSDGSAEQLLLDGSTLALTSGTGSTATNGLSYTIALTGSTATLTLSGGTLSASELNTLLNTLSYQNSSDDPTAGNRLITLSSISDNGGTANGGNDTVAPDITSTVTVQPVNDAPTLVLNSTTPTFTEGGAAVAVYNSANASTVESGQRFSGLSLQISNLSDGSAEQLLLDGSTLALTSGTGSTATNGLSYTIALTGSIATLTINGASLTAVQLETLLNTLSYQNSSDDPTAGNRLITLSSISDNGGTANGGNDTVAPDITSTVTVQPVNDAPLISAAGFTVNQGGKTTLTPLQFSFSDADHADTALEFVITSVSGGYFENATAPGVSVTRFTFNELFAGQVRFVDDNTPNTPAFSIQVSDGVASSAVLAGAVNFVPTPVVAGSGNAQAPAIVSDVVSPTEETSAVPKETPKEEASQPAPAAPVTVVSTVPSQDSTLGVQLAHKQPGDNDTPAMTVAETPLEEVEQKHITLAVAEVLSDQSGRVLSWTQMSDPLMLIKSSNFMDSLNKLDRDVQNNVTLDTVLAGTGAALSTGLSIGYVAWLLRSGIILTSVLTSLPAWRFIDPLPVLSRLGGEDTDEESLEDMVSKDNDEQSVNKA